MTEGASQRMPHGDAPALVLRGLGQHNLGHDLKRCEVLADAADELLEPPDFHRGPTRWE